MLRLDDYDVCARLRFAEESQVYSGVRKSDGRKVIIKVYPNDRSVEHDSQAQREFDVLKKISSGGVPEAIEVQRTQERPALVLEHLPGQNLGHFAKGRPMEIGLFLELAPQINEVLGRVHSARIVHGDIKPSNIMLDPSTLRVSLIDFGIATEIGHAGSHRSGLGVGTLAYIAPEQTGRMDRGIDFRSDLYELGVTFFELLTGRLPFEMTDPLELIHAHIARIPEPADRLESSVPRTLARIVSKLLEKSPDRRYQTSAGLAYDLALCAEEWNKSRCIDPELELGSADASDQLRFPDGIYGREPELEKLARGFDAASEGCPTLVLLGGPPGIGKSTLAAQLETRVLEQGGYFARGKFDSYRGDQAMQAFTAALHALAEQVLTESGTRVERWRDRLREDVGSIGRVVVDLIPALEPLLPGLDPVPAAGPQQSLRRLITALQRLIGVFADEGRPLVLVLDDLHSADPASLLLIEELLQSSEPRHLLMLATHRNPDDTHRERVAHLRERLTRMGLPYTSLDIGVLSSEHTHAWLCDLLHHSSEDIRPLADRVSRTTGDHPFLTRQYLEYLFRLGLVSYQAGEGWSWDDAALDAATIPDDVAGLLIHKIEALPDRPRQVLCIASCVGDALDLDTLEELSGIDSGALSESMEQLRTAGLLVLASPGVRFAHDRIREAAQGLLAADERADLHFEIGSRLLERTPESEIPNRVFEIMEHINRAPGRIPDDQRERMLALNLMAGQRAALSGSPSLADRYLSFARTFFRESDWTELPAQAFDLHFLSAETAYAEGRRQDALAFLEDLERRPIDPVQLARVVGRRLSIRVLAEGLEQGVDEGLAGLRKLGLSISPRPGRFTLYASIVLAAWEIWRSGEEGFYRNRYPKDPRHLGRGIIISALGPATYRYNAALFARILPVILRTHRRHGLPAGASLALFSFAHIQTKLTGNYRLAYRIGQLARRVADREPSFTLNPLRMINEHLLVTPWVRHRRASIEPLREAQQIAEEAGEAELMLYAAFYHHLILYLVGEPLPVVLENFERYSGASLRLTGGNTMAPLIDVVETLRQAAPLDDAAVERALSDMDARVAPILATLWMGALYVLKRYERAFLISEDILDQIDQRAVTMPHVPEFWLMRGLSAAALVASPAIADSDAGPASPVPRYTGATQRRWRRALRHSLRKLRGLAQQGPENFAHQALLLEAGRLAAKGLRERALVTYRRATETAQAHGYHHHAAIACERRAEICRADGLPREAACELARALMLYREWGASAKTTQMLREYEELLQDYPPPGPSLLNLHSETSSVTHTSTVGIRSTQSMNAARGESRSLDMTALLRASEALSGELRLDRVLERVMTLAIETAGAQRAVLLLHDGNDLRIEAERQVEGPTQRSTDRPLASESPDRLPISVVQYVEHARKTIVVGQATREGLFQNDPYVCRHNSKSILSLPILRQTKLVGVLYLENDLAPNAFTQKSVDVLGLLSTHAAISLDNARLYHQLRDLNLDLEQRVDSRTEELRTARDAAQAADRAKSEFLAVMSHEIRTPMNVVIGMAQILEETPLAEDQRECVGAVRTAGNSLLTLINDILDFSKIEAGKLEIETIPFSLRGCVEEVVEILAARATEKQLELPVFVDRSLPDSIVGDPVRLKQVMINFVNNALKFTEHGEVSLRVVPQTAGTIRVEVSDTGIGIPADRLDRLFESFSQVDVSTTRKYGGTGLGLAISRGLIEAMQGRVGVESVEGQGSTFWFEVPLVAGPTEKIPPMLPLDSIRIAILMEHRRSAEGLRETLRRLGGDAGLFADHREAARWLQGSPRGLLLVRHPLDRTEWEPWLRELKASDRVVPLIMPTLQSRPDAELELGAGRFLAWPVKQRALYRALASCLGVETDATHERQTTTASRTGRPTDAARDAPRIIVAEDYPLNQKLIVRLLERFGFACDVVDNGQMLVEATHTGSYDLALCDCQMPVLDGFGATREIRKREGRTGEHLPIIAMTANAMKGDRERCLDAGMDDYISKPIQVDSLRRLLAKHLE